MAIGNYLYLINPGKRDSDSMTVKKEGKKKKIMPVKKTAVAVKKKAVFVKGKKTAKKEIIIAPAEVCFWVWNGPALQSLLDLREAFKVLSDEQYSHHVNKEKNDFAAWVSAILKDEPCAKDLSKAKNMKGALKIVEKCLEGYAV